MHTHKAVKKSWRAARMQFSIIKTHNIEPDSMSLSWSTLTVFSRAPKAFPRHHKTPHGDRSRCRSIGSCGSGACQIAFSSEVQPQTSSVTTSLIVTTYINDFFKPGIHHPGLEYLGLLLKPRRWDAVQGTNKVNYTYSGKKNRWEDIWRTISYPLGTHYNHLYPLVN